MDISQLLHPIFLVKLKSTTGLPKLFHVKNDKTVKKERQDKTRGPT